VLIVWRRTGSIVALPFGDVVAICAPGTKAPSISRRMEFNHSERAQGLSKRTTDAPARKQPVSAPVTDRDDKATTITAPHNDVAADLHHSDGASVFAQSTISGYTPSYSSGRVPLLPKGRRSSVQHDLRKTTGRKAYLGACKALDILVPIDYNEDVTSMHDSSVAKLGRAFKKQGGPSR
jgi:hypothetical protein